MCLRGVVFNYVQEKNYFYPHIHKIANLLVSFLYICTAFGIVAEQNAVKMAQPDGSRWSRYKLILSKNIKIISSTTVWV
jgi:hypothetical protein